MPGRSTYHHGDLRSALLASALDVVREQGVAGLSLGEVARRVGVSSAAPYRHFANRSVLVSAAAAVAGRDLHATLLAAMDRVPRVGAGRGTTDVAVEELAAAARAYVEFALRHGAGFELVMADEVQDVEDAERSRVTGDLVALLLSTSLRVTGDPATAERLLRRFTGVVHGYANIPRSGFMRGHDIATSVLADEAADVVTLVATAARRSPD